MVREEDRRPDAMGRMDVHRSRPPTDWTIAGVDCRDVFLHQIVRHLLRQAENLSLPPALLVAESQIPVLFSTEGNRRSTI